MMIVNAGGLANNSALSSAFAAGGNIVWDRDIGKFWVHHGMKFLSNYFASLREHFVRLAFLISLTSGLPDATK